MDFRHASAQTVALLLMMLATSTALARPQEGVSTLLLHKTQAFSDASQRNDVKAMTPLLDDHVVFFNEGGDQASKADMIAPGPNPPPGTAAKMTVLDWNCQVHGDVAVASFIDDQVINSDGETFHAKYGSVETWLKRDGSWRMIGSETIALHDDPPAVALAPSLLDEYVGTYQSAAGSKFRFARDGADLTASLDGGHPTIQKAEVRDVLFTPGRARFRKVFQRNANGRVVSFAYRREGHDKIYKRVDH